MVNLHLVLGCFGRVENGFISCSKVENNIIILQPQMEYYHDIMVFLDGCKLFDRHMLDYNGIKNVLFGINNRFISLTNPIWTKRQFSLYEEFIISHKNCGLYLKLLIDKKVKKINKKSSPDENSVLIMGSLRNANE